MSEARTAYWLKHDDRSRLKGKSESNEIYCYVVACEASEEIGALAVSGLPSGETEHLSVEEGKKICCLKD